MPTASSLVRPWRSKVGGTAPPWWSAAASSAVADGGARACTPGGGARLALQPGRPGAGAASPAASRDGPERRSGLTTRAPDCFDPRTAKARRPEQASEQQGRPRVGRGVPGVREGQAVPRQPERAGDGEPGCRDQDGRERTVPDHLRPLAGGCSRRPPGSAAQAGGVPAPAVRVAIVGAVGVDAPALAVELPVQPGVLGVGETVARHVPVLAVEAVLLALEPAGLAAGQRAVVVALLDAVLLVLEPALDLRVRERRRGREGTAGAQDQGRGDHQLACAYHRSDSCVGWRRLLPTARPGSAGAGGTRPG